MCGSDAGVEAIAEALAEARRAQVSASQAGARLEANAAAIARLSMFAS